MVSAQRSDSPEDEPRLERNHMEGRYCVPAGCSRRDLENMLDWRLYLISMEFAESDSAEKNSELDSCLTFWQLVTECGCDCRLHVCKTIDL